MCSRSPVSRDSPELISRYQLYSVVYWSDTTDRGAKVYCRDFENNETAYHVLSRKFNHLWITGTLRLGNCFIRLACAVNSSESKLALCFVGLQIAKPLSKTTFCLVALGYPGVEYLVLHQIGIYSLARIPQSENACQ